MFSPFLCTASPFFGRLIPSGGIGDWDAIGQNIYIQGIKVKLLIFKFSVDLTNFSFPIVEGREGIPPPGYVATMMRWSIVI